MAFMNISLPDPMRDYVQKRIDASIEEAVQELEGGGGRELGAFCRELTAEIEAQGQQRRFQ